MRWFFLILFAVAVMFAVGIGPRGEKFSKPPLYVFNDMDWQDKLKFQKPSEFFENGQGARKPVANTVPIGYTFPTSPDSAPAESEYFLNGTFGDYYGDGMPAEVTVDNALLQRGQERYQIFCTPCHGTSGNGQGIVSKYWAIPPTANLLDPRVVAMPDGQIFWTITHGKGLMGPYNGAIPAADRWAITAYVRAMQAAGGSK
ncbi:MAG: cytochrome c [Verrucomicrobiales bacterium]|nr:cytochrome c [Verrucomicrobiales bacterium]